MLGLGPRLCPTIPSGPLRLTLSPAHTEATQEAVGIVERALERGSKQALGENRRRPCQGRVERGRAGTSSGPGGPKSMDTLVAQGKATPTEPPAFRHVAAASPSAQPDTLVTGPG